MFHRSTLATIPCTRNSSLLFIPPPTLTASSYPLIWCKALSITFPLPYMLDSLAPILHIRPAFKVFFPLSFQQPRFLPYHSQLLFVFLLFPSVVSLPFSLLYTSTQSLYLFSCIRLRGILNYLLLAS